MGDRNLFLGPHVITAQSQRGIGIIESGAPPMPPMVPMLYRPRRDDEKTLSRPSDDGPALLSYPARSGGCRADVRGTRLRPDAPARKCGAATYSFVSLVRQVKA